MSNDRFSNQVSDLISFDVVEGQLRLMHGSKPIVFIGLSPMQSDCIMSMIGRGAYADLFEYVNQILQKDAGNIQNG